MLNPGPHADKGKYSAQILQSFAVRPVSRVEKSFRFSKARWEPIVRVKTSFPAHLFFTLNYDEKGFEEFIASPASLVVVIESDNRAVGGTSPRCARAIGGRIQVHEKTKRQEG